MQEAECAGVFAHKEVECAVQEVKFYANGKAIGTARLVLDDPNFVNLNKPGRWVQGDHYFFWCGEEHGMC